MPWRQRLFGDRWRIRAGSEVPAHVQIEEQLAERIASRELSAGERLPPERELAKGLGVSRMTVRQALGSLDARGLVERGVGRGTFVAHRKLDHDLTRVAGLTERLERQGLEPGAGARARWTRARRAGRSPPALELKPGSPVVRIRRLRLGGGVPLALEDSWIPGEEFSPGLADRDLSRLDLRAHARGLRARAGARGRAPRAGRSRAPTRPRRWTWRSRGTADARRADGVRRRRDAGRVRPRPPPGRPGALDRPA